MGNNSVNNYPKLVGGTFLCILLQYKKDTRVEEAVFIKDFLSVLGGDIDVKKDKYGNSSTRTQITRLKKCQANSFSKDFLFHTRLSKKLDSFEETCKEMESFITKHLEDYSVGDFVADLLQIIKEDSSINNKSFLLNDKLHSSISLAMYHDAEKICLPYIPFIVSVAVYAFSEANTQGLETIEKWSEDDSRNSKIVPDIGLEYRKRVENSPILRICHLEKTAGQHIENQDGIESDNKVTPICDSLADTQKKLPCSNNISGKVVSPPPPFRVFLRDKIDDDEHLYCIDEKDYQALWKQANNTERDQRDLNALVAEIKRKRSLYVKTDVYRETYNKIRYYGYVLLTGNPGTGKSMTSELVALKFAGTGEYIVHYLKDYDEADVKKLYDEISSPTAQEEKHFILIDDCMGQAFYQLDCEEEKWFYNLVAYITMRPQRLKLLLNSRINIVESSKQHRIYEKIFEEMFKTQRVVDANKLTKMEKALILRAHVIGKSDRAHYEDIRGKRAVDIVNHKPYIPRVIYHVTAKGKPIRESGDFFKEIISALDNPASIWEEIYDDDKATPPEARILLKALFSLTNNMVELKICRMVFDEYLRLSEVRTEPRKAWNIALRSLNSSMIKRDVADEEMIGFMDPSVHDFLLRSIYCRDSNEWNSLFDGIVHKQQIESLYGSEKERILASLVPDGRILNIAYENNLERDFEIFDFIAKNGYCLQEYKEVFSRTVDCLSRRYNSGSRINELFRYVRYEHLGDRMLIALMEKPELREFYCGGKIQRSVYDAFTLRSEIFNATSIIETFYKTGSNCFDFAFDIESMKNLIVHSCDYTSVDTNDYIKEIINELDTEDPNVLNKAINQMVKESYYSEIETIHGTIPESIYETLLKTIDDYDFEADYSTEINDYLNYQVYEDYNVDYYVEMEVLGRDEDRAVEEVFDKPFND